MLHILWMIIKFILILLGIVLGLVLLALLLVLFCPVRYQAQAEKKAEDSLKEVRAQAKVSWLFRGISCKVMFHGGEVGYSVRILGIPLDKLMKRKKKETPKPGKVHKEAAGKKRSGKKVSHKEDTTAVGEIADKEESVLAEETVPEADTSEKHIPDVVKPNEDAAQQMTLETNDNADAGKEMASESLSEEFRAKKSPAELIQTVWEKLKKILGFPVMIFRKIIAVPGIILEKIRKIALTFHNIYDKIEQWKEFVNHPRTKAAIALVKKEAKGLIFHILPTKVEGELTFGSENPAITGTVLAILGMTIPFHKNCIAVTPSFEGENVLSGNIALKGRAYGFILVKTAIQIYFNKNIKFVINRWKTRRAN